VPGLQNVFTNYIDNNLNPNLSEKEIEEYHFLFNSLIKSVIPCLALSIVLFLFNLKLAAFLFLVAASYL